MEQDRDERWRKRRSKVTIRTAAEDAESLGLCGSTTIGIGVEFSDCQWTQWTEDLCHQLRK